MMNSLPSKWAYKNIKDVLLPLADGKLLHQGWSPRCEPDTSEDATEWAALKTTAIQDGSFDGRFNKRLPRSLSPKPELEVHSGDILLTCAGPRGRCGVACMVKETRPRLMISGKMYRFRADEAQVIPEFLLAYLRSDESQAAIDKMKTGGNESGLNLTQDRFFRLDVPVAPIEVQRRIVDTLDKLLAHSKASRSELERIPRLIERIKLATVARFLPSSDKQSTERMTLAELCVPGKTITYGVIKLGEEVPEGIPCLRTSNVRWLRIETEEMKRIARELSLEYSRTILEGAEVLVNVRGTLGGVAVASSEMKGWNVSREVAVVPVDTSRFDSDYVAFWIGSEKSQSWLRGVEKGVAYTGINLDDLRKLPVLCPPINEQRRIVKLIRAGHQRADLIALEVSRVTTLNERLEKAALEKAFRGELLLEEKPLNAVAAL